jgi:hypothetical protein
MGQIIVREGKKNYSFANSKVFSLVNAAVLRIRIRIKMKGRIRLCIKKISWIRIRINMQTPSQNVWNMSLFEHFFRVFSFYLEAGIRIRIKVKGRIRIRMTVKSRIRIRIRIRIKVTSGSGSRSASM